MDTPVDELVKGQPESRPQPLPLAAVVDAVTEPMNEEAGAGGCGHEREGPQEVGAEEKITLSVPSPPRSPDISLMVSAIEAESDTISSRSPGTSSLHSLCSMEGSLGSSGSGELSLPLRFLCEAHTHMGKMGWCCKNSGSFLLQSVNALRKELQLLTKWPLKQREVS